MNKKLQLVVFTTIQLIISSSLLAGSDLIVSSPSINSTIFEAGNTISVNFTLNNIGTVASRDSYTGPYLSIDNIMIRWMFI
jgi:hypothetical protein